MAPIAAAIARILVPTDYSDTADHALEWALLQGKTFGAEVTVLHVIPKHLHLGAIGFADQPEEGDPAEDLEHLAAHVAKHLGDSGLKCGRWSRSASRRSRSARSRAATRSI